jgi:hypothetical protein
MHQRQGHTQSCLAHTPIHPCPSPVCPSRHVCPAPPKPMGASDVCNAHANGHAGSTPKRPHSRAELGALAQAPAANSGWWVHAARPPFPDAIHVTPHTNCTQLPAGQCTGPHCATKAFNQERFQGAAHTHTHTHTQQQNACLKLTPLILLSCGYVQRALARPQPPNYPTMTPLLVHAFTLHPSNITQRLGQNLDFGFATVRHWRCWDGRGPCALPEAASL